MAFLVARSFGAYGELDFMVTPLQTADRKELNNAIFSCTISNPIQLSLTPK